MKEEWHSDWCIETTSKPCIFILFGAVGDLAHRKLFPSLYLLHRRELLPPDTRIIGCARPGLDDEAFQAQVKESLPDGRPEELNSFLARICYLGGDYLEPEIYRRIREKLAECDRSLSGDPFNRLFYLATPATVYTQVTAHLGEAGLLNEKGGAAAGAWRHVVLEKPFGYDLRSAEELDQHLHRYLKESQIYRIDHYLGKETVQNIAMLRFCNTLFEPVWNSLYIDHVQITAAETLGVEHRGNYYERAGLLRDMFQNHMLAMLSLAAMEMPSVFDADSVRDEKLKLIRSIRPFREPAADFVRAQYAAGNGKPGYREEPLVSPDSRIETYVAGRFFIDNWRWRGVPFYLRSGKRLKTRKSEIAVVFKRVPHSILPAIRAEEMAPASLVMKIQPAEGLALTIEAKRPGPKLCLGEMTLDFNYGESGGNYHLDAYGRLLLDALLGDQTLFIRNDITAVGWELFTPVLECWEKDPEDCPLHSYEAGSEGPDAAAQLLRKDGREWRTLE